MITTYIVQYPINTFRPYLRCSQVVSNSLFYRNCCYCKCLIKSGFAQIRLGSSLQQIHARGAYKRAKNVKRTFGGKPFAKGIVIRVLIKKPKKPNSANRKCVLVRLSTGKEMVAHVPGEGHNLQEHNIVLCRVGKVRDTPGVNIKCVRGKYDLPHVIKKTN